jgi:hypothetical protein
MPHIKPFVKGITEIGPALDPYFGNALNLGLYTMGPLTWFLGVCINLVFGCLGFV